MGLILCAHRDEAVAHYALEALPNKVLAAEYVRPCPTRPPWRRRSGRPAGCWRRARRRDGTSTMGRRKRARGRDWWSTARLLEAVISERAGPDAEVEVGRVRKLGGGAYRRAFIAWVEVEPDPHQLSRAYVCLIPHWDAPPSCTESVQMEARLMRALEPLDLSFRVPRLLAEASMEGSVALVETAVDGTPMSNYKGRGEVRPWEITGHVAAAVHAIADPAVLGCVTGFESRRQHAEDCATMLQGQEEPLLEEIQAWVREHLPPATPSVLLHGDLLGQNILINTWERDQPPAVIDWSLAEQGDPAYDLAIVTRGVRRPFKKTDGLARLLDAYAEAGGQQLTASEVHLHELCMQAGWYQESLVEEGTAQEEHYLGVLRGLFKRVQGSGG